MEQFGILKVHLQSRWGTFIPQVGASLLLYGCLIEYVFSSRNHLAYSKNVLLSQAHYPVVLGMLSVIGSFQGLVPLVQLISLKWWPLWIC